MQTKADILCEYEAGRITWQEAQLRMQVQSERQWNGIWWMLLAFLFLGSFVGFLQAYWP